MPFDEPGWWYQPADTRAARLLGPASELIGWMAARRLQRPARYHSRLPVICIGNFTAGGTGKTPLTLHIARTLQQLGHRPACLSRGYGGKSRGPQLVRAEHDMARDVGDEPLLLARGAPTIVARDRVAGAQFIEALPEEARADCILMDDGLQNPHLEKRLKLAVVDGRRGFGNGRVLPAGPLRAPLAVQLAQVDGIVVNRLGGIDTEPAVARWLRQEFKGPVLDATVRPVPPFDWLRDQPVVAYCGIGAPARFLDLLTKLGARVVSSNLFPDHHAFSERDSDVLLGEARRHGARLVTTEKDWVRLSGFEDGRAALKAASTPLAIAAHLEPGEQKRLTALLESALARRP